MGDAILDRFSVLTIPGWNGSGAEHWQTLWERDCPNFQRIGQHDWIRPSREDWLDRMESSVQAANRPALLVAHSLGCLAVAHLAAEGRARGVAGAFLVAPPWLSNPDGHPAELAGFRIKRFEKLPFPSAFIASENDPHLPIDLGTCMSKAWGSRFVNAGPQGHINADSGHGPWPFGMDLLRRLALDIEGVNG